jgi:inorganic pyrophosphatase
VSKRSKNTYVEPTGLPPFTKKNRSVLQVVIETPKGSRNKYKFDPKLGAFKLSKVLPDGMDFPYDFGFVPSTEGEDGDPIDVLLLMDESAFPGCVIESRLIGVIEGEQDQNGKKERNDRLVAVPLQNHRHSDLKDLADLNQTLVKELGQFFVNYHQRAPSSRFSVLRDPKKQTAS